MRACVAKRHGALYVRRMVTRLYTHPIYLEHLTPTGHPERPDRLRAIARVLDDEAFAALDRAWQVRDPELGAAKTDPFLDPLRKDPRYSALLMQMGFPT